MHKVLSAAEQSQCVHNQGVASLIRYSSLIQQQTRLTQENIKIENLLIRTFFTQTTVHIFMVAHADVFQNLGMTVYTCWPHDG